MRFIGKNKPESVQLTTNQTVACGLHGTIIEVDRNPNQSNARFKVLWDNYNVGIYAYRDEFLVIYQNSKEEHQKAMRQLNAQNKRKIARRTNM